MVGLEAKPPMGDGQPNPNVTFGYKRQEIALIPVCPVDPYDPKRLEPNATTESRKVKCKITEQQANAGSSRQNHEKQRNGSNVKRPPAEPTIVSPENHKTMPSEAASASKQDSGDNKKKNDQEILVTSGSAIKNEHDDDQLRRQDSYSTLGLFRMGLSWFGPAKIEQFVATGQAASAIQVPKKKDEKKAPPPPGEQDRKEQGGVSLDEKSVAPQTKTGASSSTPGDAEKKETSTPGTILEEQIPVSPPTPATQ
jgi:hypothetical protein